MNLAENLEPTEVESPEVETEQVEDTQEVETEVVDDVNEEVIEESSPLIEQLNDLGIIRKGLPVEFESIEQITELLSKGFDYTQKTQELSSQTKSELAKIEEERASFQQEREAYEQEKEANAEDLQAANIFATVLQNMQQKAPDLFQEVMEYYQPFAQQSYVNPVVNKEIQALRDEISSLKNAGKVEQVDNSISQWETGLKDFMGKHKATLKASGFKPDYSKMLDMWSKDNNMSVEDAYYAVHGKAAVSLAESKQKIAEIKKKKAALGSPVAAKPQEQEKTENTAFSIAKAMGFNI